MHPVLFHLGDRPVPTHDFFVALGIVTAVVVFVLRARSAGRLDRSMVLIASVGLLGGGIGARLGNVIRYWFVAPDPSLTQTLVESGKTVVGGLAGAYVGVLVAKRLIGYRGHTGDVFAPAVALGIAVGRIGCLLTEPPGRPTTLPWGVHVSDAAAARMPNCDWCADGVAMHPSFLYEIVFLLALAAVLFAVRPRLAHLPGETFTLFLLAYALFRFAVEFVRVDDVVGLGLTRPQWFLLVTIPFLVVHVVRRVRRGEYRAPVDDPRTRLLEGVAP